MATSSTIPTVKAQFVTRLGLRSGLSGVKISYAWPGPAGTAEMMYFGEPQRPGDSPIASLKTGRKTRDEEYDLVLVIETFKAGQTSDQASTVEARGFALLAELEGELADDPKIGLGTVVSWMQLTGYDVRLFPFETGWTSQIVATVSVKARLT